MHFQFILREESKYGRNCFLVRRNVGICVSDRKKSVWQSMKVSKLLLGNLNFNDSPINIVLMDMVIVIWTDKCTHRFICYIICYIYILCIWFILCTSWGDPTFFNIIIRLIDICIWTWNLWLLNQKSGTIDKAFTLPQCDNYWEIARCRVVLTTHTKNTYLYKRTR